MITELMRQAPWVVFCLVMGLSSAPAVAGQSDEPEGESTIPPLTFFGLLDLRYAHTSQQSGWLNGGTNILRYGGKDTDNDFKGDRDAHVFAIPQASLVMETLVPPGANIHVQANFSADNDSGNAAAGLIEAYADFERGLGQGRARLRLGEFIPPISMEHPGPAWSTRYTLTPSAIGSWIGEEVRAVGGQASWETAQAQPKARIIGAVFGGDDQAGRVLYDRGWALHDFQAGINTSLPLPTGKREPPFRELDGRPGFYGQLDSSLFENLIDVRGGYWDNGGDINAVTADGAGSLETYRTRFWHGGAKLEWVEFSVLTQFVRGSSATKTCPRWYWDSWYDLVAYEWRHWTFSGRYDHFFVERGADRGYAWTADVQWDWSRRRQRLSLEYLRASTRSVMPTRPSLERDQLLQLNYRLLWGNS